MVELNLEHIHIDRLMDLSQKRCEILILNKNYLRYVFSELLPSTLKHLSLDQNDIHHLELSNPLPHLQTLSIERNDLQYMDLDVVLPSLHTFNAKANDLWNLRFLASMPALKHLTLSHNHLKTLDTLPSTLQTLTCKFSKVSLVQSRLPDGLEVLDLLGNELRMGSLPLHWGTHLRVLNLGYNHLKEFPKRLPDSLEELRLMENKIESIPTRLPANLKQLILTRNKLRVLPPRTNVRLDVLLLAHNQLTQDVETTPVSWAIHILAPNNWNEEEHHQAQRKIRRCWKRYLLKKRLRHLARSRRIYSELLMVALHPDHILQTDTFSPEWFR